MSALSLGWALLACAHLAVLLALWGSGLSRAARSRPEPAAPGSFPPILLIIPFTGRDTGMEAALHSLLRQDYSPLTVFLATRGESDPAGQLALELTARYPHARHVQTKPAIRCGQKNQALLDALAVAPPDTDIFVFCDAGHLAAPDFIQRLVRPILSGRARFCSGYRRTRLLDTDAAAVACHVLVRHMGFLQSLPLFTQPWGGALAVKASAFHELNVAALWQRTVADDVSLAGLLHSRRERVVYCPEALLDSPLVAMPRERLTSWFFRQVLCPKFYTPGIWLGLGIGLFCLAAPPFAGLGILAAWAAGAAVPGICALLALAHALAVAALQERLRRRIAPGCPFPAWLKGLLLAARTALCVYLRTIPARELVWHGITYSLTAGGYVARIRDKQG